MSYGATVQKCIFLLFLKFFFLYIQNSKLKTKKQEKKDKETSFKSIN